MGTSSERVLHVVPAVLSLPVLLGLAARGRLLVVLKL